MGVDETTIRDVSAWMDALKPLATPLFNYFQRFGFAIDDPYEGALIGHERAKHPVLARLLGVPYRIARRGVGGAMWWAGLVEDEDEDNVCGLAEADTGFNWLARRIATVRDDWAHREPIYDGAKVAENRRRIAEERANRPPTYWGMRQAESRAALDVERRLLTRKDTTT